MKKIGYLLIIFILFISCQSNTGPGESNDSVSNGNNGGSGGGNVDNGGNNGGNGDGNADDGGNNDGGGNNVGWKTVGTDGFSVSSVDNPSLIIFGNTPYVTYKAVYIYAEKFENGAWKKLGSPIEKTIVYGNNYFGISENGTLYITYSENNLSSGSSYQKARSRKFNGNNWINFSTDISSVDAENISMAIKTEQNLYAAYINKNTSKAEVKKYNNGGAWVDTAINITDINIVDDIAITISSDNNLYIAAYDKNAQKIVVKKYDGTSWQKIGGVIDGDNASISVYNNTQYISYRKKNAREFVVAKYNGASWEQLGKEFAEGGAEYIPIKISKNGIPYVAYPDTLDNNKITVMKYNLTTRKWEVLGKKGFSKGGVNFISLAVSDSGVPYVGYADFDGNGGKMTVMKYE